MILKNVEYQEKERREEAQQLDFNLF